MEIMLYNFVQCGDDVLQCGKCGDNVAQWVDNVVQCGDKLLQCRDNVTTVWRQCGNNMETMWRQCLVVTDKWRRKTSQCKDEV